MPAAPPSTARQPSFTVPTGILAGSYDAVLLSTDLEPDDAIAIIALAQRLRGVPLLVVLGEGAADKRTMAAELLKSCDLDDERVVVVQGKRSTAALPSGVTDAYNESAGGRAHRCKLHPDEGEAIVPKLVEEFLRAHAAPFALLLKPPHELLAAPVELLRKTRAALYGSFNLSELRKEMGGGEAASEEARLARQFALMRGFDALLWVERSCSVGRDCVLEPDVCARLGAPNMWQAVDADAALTAHIQLRNAETVRAVAQKVARLPFEVDEALGGSGSAAPPAAEGGGSGGGGGGGGATPIETEAAADPRAARCAAAAKTSGSVPGTEAYERLRPCVDRVDKRIRILVSISHCRGRQVCHADTLVAAALLDDRPAAAGGGSADFGGGGVASFERPCKLEADAHGRPSFAPDPASRVAVLYAAPGDERERLVRASFTALERTLSGPS